LIRVNSVTDRGGILLTALVVILDSVIVEEDLVPITVVVHHDGTVGTFERTLKGNLLLGTPPTIQETVEDNNLPGTAETDVEENVVAIEAVEGGVVVGLAGDVQVEFCGLEDDDAISLQLVLERDGSCDVKEIEHGDDSFWQKSVTGKVGRVGETAYLLVLWNEERIELASQGRLWAFRPSFIPSR
jgi:hypothetical protein